MSVDPTASPLDVYMARQVKTLDEKELQEILLWVDKIPMSREKRNLTRDMSDGGKGFSCHSETHLRHISIVLLFASRS